MRVKFLAQGNNGSLVALIGFVLYVFFTGISIYINKWLCVNITLIGYVTSNK